MASVSGKIPSEKRSRVQISSNCRASGEFILQRIGWSILNLTSRIRRTAVSSGVVWPVHHFCSTAVVECEVSEENVRRVFLFAVLGNNLQ